MPYDLMPIFQQLQSERKIDRQILLEAIRNALETASRKIYHYHPALVLEFDETNFTISIFQEKKVVDVVKNKGKEISLEDAQEIDPNVEIGGKVKVDISPESFGRIAAQTARQVIIQRLKDAERDNVFREFKDKEGKLVTGTVTRLNKGNIVVNLGDVEGIVPPREQSHRDNFRPGDRIRAYCLEVDKTSHGAGVILSRTTPDLVRELFRLEVPEIYDEIIEIKAIAREAGTRTKIAVASNDPNIDPVGACVGVKGQRVSAIVDELRGEKIDIVKYSDDIAAFVSNALNPAEIANIGVDYEDKLLEVIVPKEQLSLAIGKKGQNARLAARLTGWKIDIRTDEELEQERQTEKEDALAQLRKLDFLSPELIEQLSTHGLWSFENIHKVSRDTLAKIPGMNEELADRLKQAAEAAHNAPPSDDQQPQTDEPVAALDTDKEPQTDKAQKEDEPAMEENSDQAECDPMDETTDTPS